MKKLLLSAAVILTAFTLPASALTWNFGEHGSNVALPNIQPFDTGGFFLTAKGFDGSDNGTALYSKNLGTGETGLGLVDDPSHTNEITGLNFIQLNLDGLRSALTNFTFSMDSVDHTEGWAVYGSNDAHPFQFTLLASSLGFGDNGVHSLADGWDNYNFFYTGGACGTGCDANVLLHSFSADLATVPLPGAIWLFASGLGGLVMLNRRRRKAIA